VLNLPAIERLRRRRFKKYLKRRPKLKSKSVYRDSTPTTYKYNNTAPENFSFVNNTDEMLGFFQKGKDVAQERVAVKFDLRDISKLTSDAIAIYASILNDKNYCPGARISGNMPRKTDLKHLFMASGFYDHVNSKAKPKTHENHFLLHKISESKVEPSIAKKATDFASEKTFKSEIKFRPLYEILIELMANTNNHATPLEKITEKKYDWWLYVFYDKLTNITSYTFLDFGVGIFESQSFRTYKDFILIKWGKEKPPTEMAEDLLNGKISSRTGKDERGRGFKCITDNVTRKEFKKFVIISNSLYIDVKNRTSSPLSNSFNGTFAYWEIQNVH
jgi:hypothetical protein